MGGREGSSFASSRTCCRSPLWIQQFHGVRCPKIGPAEIQIGIDVEEADECVKSTASPRGAGDADYGHGHPGVTPALAEHACPYCVLRQQEGEYVVEDALWECGPPSARLPWMIVDPCRRGAPSSRCCAAEHLEQENDNRGKKWTCRTA